MKDLTIEHLEEDKLSASKKLAAAVYLCQALTFLLAGLPLLIGVAINFIWRKDVEGTWLASHFNWQIQTTWVALAGFAIAGLTFGMGIGLFVLIITVIWMVYRIVLGWNALNDDKVITGKQ